MSGLEVVGLLLGTFPLIISALEHYENMHRAIGLLTRFESEYRKTVDDVKDEQLLLRLSLEELLLPLTKGVSLESGDLEALISDPTGPGWKDEDVVGALKERLGTTYERFMEIASSLHALTSRLLGTLISDKPELQAKLRAKMVRKDENSRSPI